MKSRTVSFTTAALRDLSQSHDWLVQPGSGNRSKAIATTLVRAAKALSDTAGSHPQDRFFADCRQLVVSGYVIRYRVVLTDAGERVSIERIDGPGQDRIG